MFDYCSTGKIVNGVNKHSPEHGRTSMASWKLHFLKGKHSGAVVPLIRAHLMAEGTQCSGSMLTVLLEYPVVFISYSLST